MPIHNPSGALSPARLGPVPLPLPTQLVALAARDSVTHPWLIQAFALQAARGQYLGVILGNNHLNLYALVRVLRQLGLDPCPALARIELSRAFTCHQLHQRIRALTPPMSRWSALFVLGLLDTFCDEDVTVTEATRLLLESLAYLQRLSRSGLPVLVTLPNLPPPGREHFLDLVASRVDLYWQPDRSKPKLPAPRQLALPLGRD